MKRVFKRKIKNSHLIPILPIMIGIILVHTATAVVPEKKIGWKTPMGVVVFDGKAHSIKGFTCNHCHEKLFEMKPGRSVMTHEEFKKGKFCGACHNGIKAFNTLDTKKCRNCHIESSEIDPSVLILR